MLTQSELKENLHYSIIAGQFYRLKSTGSRAKAGDIAGTYEKDGYRVITVNHKTYKAHRLAWFYCTGEWPANEIDHINCIKDANYWLNLREATHSQNMHNKGLPSNNISGFKGVYWNKAVKKWHVQIMINRKQKYLGLFDDVEDAYAARLKAEKELHGDFARN